MSLIALGVDIGTTSIKAALVEVETWDIVSSFSERTDASVSSVEAEGSEQCVQKIWCALSHCLHHFSSDLLKRVTKIALCGQMHGVVYWKYCNDETNVLNVQNTSPSNLITWEDGRCSEYFLSSLPKSHSQQPLASGFGCATTFWLHRNCPEFLKQYTCAGTIQDYIVAILCNLEKPVMCMHNAGSWGYYDSAKECWDTETHGIPKATPVYTALGDLQCSFMAHFQSPADLVLNIGTSAQVAHLMPPNFQPDSCSDNDPLHYWPFSEGRYLAVVASLNGGNVLQCFVKVIKQWISALGISIEECDIWKQLDTFCEVDDRQLPTINPLIFGERHSGDILASISNMHANNMDLRSVYGALCIGLVKNLRTMSDAMLKTGTAKNIVGTGSVLSKNKIMQEAVKTSFQLPFHVCDNTQYCDAAVGAVKFVIRGTTP